MSFLRFLRTGLVITVISVVLGCSEPPVPPEVQMAISQEQDLWRAGAPLFAPQEYRGYLDALKSSRELLTREQARFLWFRDYEKVALSFRQVVELGETIHSRVRENKAARQAEVAARTALLRQKIRGLRNLSENVKDRRLAARRLMKAELLVDEADGLSLTERYAEASDRLDGASTELEAVVGTVTPLVRRYADRSQIAAWRRLLDEAVAASRKDGGYLVVVSKIDRELTVYRKGVAVRAYPAGLGSNFLSDKLYSGDRATPEGKYRIIKKLPNSKYFRGLLIDYPNAEDQKRFARAKKEGRLPAGARIGGLIEIHGGGKDGLTYGCIALENAQMLEIYDLVGIGTPVVILGAVNFDNVVSSFLRRME